MIQNLIFKIYFLKKVFRACNFYIFPHVSVDIIRVFFNFIFFSRESQSQQELPKKATHFTIQFLWKTSLIIWTSTHLTLKIICCCNTAKNLSEFTKKFPASMSLFGVKKKHLHSTVSWRPKLHSWSTLKANVRLFLYISVRTEVVKFYLMGVGWREAE